MSEQFPHNNPEIQQPQEFLEAENEFAQLWQIEVADIGPDSGLAASVEAVRDPRITQLFEVRPTLDQQPTKVDSFDYARLLRGEPQPAKTAETYQEKQARLDEEARYIKEPSEGSKLQAFFALRKAKDRDPIIEAIVDKYIPKPDGIPDSSAEADAMRTNPDLRYELGSYLLRDKLPKIMRENPHAMPYRISVNQQKHPNHPGYAHLGYITGQEYAAMLAMSMLDGTFSDPGSGDAIERSSQTGQIETGQHRSAALELLGDPSVK